MGYGNNQCQPGWLQTQFGCQPQGSCPINTALYNNSCIPATTNMYGGNGMNGLANNCPVGTIPTQQFGCLPQGTCMGGQALYNGQCINALGSGSIGAIGNNGWAGGGWGGNQVVAPVIVETIPVYTYSTDVGFEGGFGGGRRRR
jgi:hypothetical protein